MIDVFPELSDPIEQMQAEHHAQRTRSATILEGEAAAASHSMEARAEAPMKQETT